MRKSNQSELQFDRHIQFSIEYVDEIMQVIQSSVDLNDKQTKEIKKDLKYVLDPDYLKNKNVEKLLLDFQRKLNESKTNKIPSEKVTGPCYKIKLYQNIDVDRIIECLKAEFVK